jgi:hypothetical protein
MLINRRGNKMKILKYWGMVAVIGLLIGVLWWVTYEMKDQKDSMNKSDANYHSEENENNRLKKFFSDLASVYGYLYSTENGSYQLFVKIDEALLEGELTGSLLLMAYTEDTNNHYKETRYVLNGITDGHMVEFFTTVDGKKTKLKGNFYEGATGFDLSFWATEQELSFHAVTEEEFKQSYDGFKIKNFP